MTKFAVTLTILLATVYAKQAAHPLNKRQDIVFPDDVPFEYSDYAGKNDPGPAAQKAREENARVRAEEAAAADAPAAVPTKFRGAGGEIVDPAEKIEGWGAAAAPGDLPSIGDASNFKPVGKDGLPVTGSGMEDSGWAWK